jgi:hypothetical protein
MTTIKLVSGDDGPPIQFQLSDENGAALDVSDALKTVHAKFRKRGTSTVLFTATCTKVAGGYAGICELAWPAASLDVDAGYYELEFYVDTNGSIQTCYDVQRIKLRDDF